MKPIARDEVLQLLARFAGQDLYLHLETTNGAYAAHREVKVPAVGAYVRNALIHYERGSISQGSPFRVGLKMEYGWIYAEGLTDWELDAEGRLLLAGHNEDGQLTVALQLSPTPFR